MKNILILSFMLSFMSSCQTLEIAKELPSCEELDWFELGRSDGVQGIESIKWQEREKQCQNFTELDHQSYVNGWYAGVDEFCSVRHGFAYGKTGNKYSDVCPTSKEDIFLRAYRKGLKVFEFESDNKKLSQEINSLSEKATESNPERVPSILKKMGELEDKKEKNRAQIFSIEKEMENTLIETSML